MRETYESFGYVPGNSGRGVLGRAYWTRRG